MNQETLKRAAEPFFTTKPSGQGTGLGLSMAHGFAAQSGGSMRIESEPGQGTTVSLWLPASRNAATPPKPPGDQRQRRVHHGLE
jgi:signal transduction histidine kinase